MARSRSIGNVYAELSVKDKMTVGIKRAEKALAGFASSAAKWGAGIAAALPAAAFAGVAASMKSAIDAGGQLSDMMARTGADGEKLFVMQRAFENAGIAGDKVPSVLNKMQKALTGVNEEGERLQTRVFGDLGLSVEKLQSMDPAMAFRAISESIAKIPDPAKRAALAMEIFGRSGAELLVLMNDPAAFDMAAKQVGGLGKTLADNAAAFDNISDSLQTLGTKSMQIGAEIAAELLPALSQMADALNEMDLSGATKDAIGFAKAMGDVATKALEASKNLPGARWLGLAGKASGMGANVFGGLFGNVERQNPTIPPWSDDPLSNYNEGVMLPPAWELKNFTGKIPEILKKRPWTEFTPGMRLEDSGIPGVSSMIDAIAESVTPRAEEAKEMVEAEWRRTSYDVNELQSRGLGYGGENIAREVANQVSLLESIRDILKKASTNGQLVWQ